MTRGLLEETVIDIIKEVTNNNKVDINDSIELFDLDSLDKDYVVHLTEQEFRFAEKKAVWGEFWLNAITLVDLCNFIEERI